MKVGAFIPDFGSVILSLVFKRIFGRGNHFKVVCTSFMIIVNQSKPRIHFLEKHIMIGICTLLLKDSLCWLVYVYQYIFCVFNIIFSVKETWKCFYPKVSVTSVSQISCMVSSSSFIVCLCGGFTAFFP